MEKVISMDPLDAEMPADLGYTLMRTGQIESATVMMNRSVTLAADKPFSRYTRAELFLLKGELEQASQAIGATARDLVGYYLDTRLLIARAQADTVGIDQVLDNYLIADSQSLGPQFSRALVYLDRGEQDKLNILLSEMQESVQKAVRERPNAEATLLDLVAFYGLRQDKAKLTEAVNTYYASVKPDALRIVENRTIPTAYAVAGDSEALLDYLEKMVEQLGPWEFYYFAIDPSFNNMRSLPRFQALDKQYRQWLEQQQ